MRQIIIARKDLNMSPGKLAAQCCHASEAFLIQAIHEADLIKTIGTENDLIDILQISLRRDIQDLWINHIFSKTVCEAKNRTQLMKAVNIANDLGLQEGKDFFLIKDYCLTELQPEEVDENGMGKTLTCIGFRPLPEETAHMISKKFQLYK